MAKEHLATITILVKDRQKNVFSANQLLTENGHLILARLGVNIEPRCIKNCSGLIVIVVRGKGQEIKELSKKLNSLYGIVARLSIMTK